MAKQNNAKTNTTEKSRRTPALALLLVVLIAAAFFVMSDAPLVKGARDALMQKLGYEAVDESGRGRAAQTAAKKKTMRPMSGTAARR